MKRSILIALLGLVWGMAACEPIRRADLPTETAPVQTLAGSQVQEITLSPASTFPPTQTPSPIPSMTPTPDWIKMAVGNQGLVEEMEFTPGCQLPCWWGITPGETEWKDVETRLEDVNAMVSLSQSNGEQRADIYVPVSISEPINFLSIRMRLKSGIVQQIDTGEYLGPHPGDLRSFLAKNGKPDEVCVHSFASHLGGPPPFDLWLFYWDKGIAAEFFSSEERAIYRDELVKACIERGPIRYLWSDRINSVTEVDKIIPVGFGEPFYPILPVEEAIGMSLEQFYEEYRDLEDLPQLACFTSEQSVWPEP